MDYHSNRIRLNHAMREMASIVPKMKLERSLDYTEWYENFLDVALQLDWDFYNFITDDDWRLPYDDAEWDDFRTFLDTRLYLMLRSHVAKCEWLDVASGTTSGKTVLKNIVSRFGTLSYRDMVTLHFLPVLHGGDDLSDLWKLTMLSKACRKLTEEQHCGPLKPCVALRSPLRWN